MASNGSDRVGFIIAGGVLSIVAGVFQIVGGVLMAVGFLVEGTNYYMLGELFFLPFLPEAWRQEILWIVAHPLMGSARIPIWWVIIGGCTGVLGIIAIVGGVSAIRRKRFGLSLAGAICALPSWILGILAVIFVALGKREFGAERKENGI